MLFTCAGTLQRVQAAQQERAEEVHFSRAAWLDTLKGPNEDAAIARGVPSSLLANDSAGVPRSSLAALLTRSGSRFGSI